MGDRQFSEQERRELAERGEAMPDGSYPTPDCDALRRAFDSYGRETGDRVALRHYLIRRNVELGCGHPIPQSWHIRKGTDGQE